MLKVRPLVLRILILRQLKKHTLITRHLKLRQLVLRFLKTSQLKSRHLIARMVRPKGSSSFLTACLLNHFCESCRETAFGFSCGYRVGHGGIRRRVG
jgi:hypothetical protein